MASKHKTPATQALIAERFAAFVNAIRHKNGILYMAYSQKNINCYLTPASRNIE